MFEEFKKFILKGNMIDLAVGVIIGAAFGKVVEKFAEMLMSTVGKLLVTLQVPKEWLKNVGIDPEGVKFGPFVTATIYLVIVGFALFVFIKAYNRFLLKPQPAAAPAVTPTEKLLAEIRDLLRSEERALPAPKADPAPGPAAEGELPPTPKATAAPGAAAEGKLT